MRTILAAVRLLREKRTSCSFGFVQQFGLRRKGFATFFRRFSSAGQYLNKDPEPVGRGAVRAANGTGASRGT
jgi:hypothetical protein